MKSLRDIVAEYDNFPYVDSTGSLDYHQYVDKLWRFHLPGDPRPHGYILPSTVESMPWTSDFELDAKSNLKSIRLISDSPEAANAAIATLLETAREMQLFRLPQGWRDEGYLVLGAQFDIYIERAGAAIFGIMTSGVHMTVYTRSSAGEIRLWVPKRALTTKTYPGMLDNSVAGGLPAGVDPFECLVREAAEEANLSEDLTRRAAKAVGCLTAFNIREGGKGLLLPSVMYVYDMEIDEETQLEPIDGEVEEFRLMRAEEVMEELMKESFKPISAFVLIDFFILHGILTVQNEKHYAELVARIHRRLPFPTTPFD